MYTQACEDRDFAEWHRGCPWGAVWVVRLEDGAVPALVEQVRTSLHPWLLPRYARQPHITVAYRGLMGDAAGHPHAAFTHQQLQQDIELLQAAQLARFEVRLSGVGSFTTVPYVAVLPSAVLQQAHVALHAQAPYPGWQYVPHVTVGHYAQQLPMAQVMQALAGSVAPGLLWEGKVDELWLARYQTHDIAGPLTFEGRFDLRTQSYHAEPGALLGR